MGSLHCIFILSFLRIACADMMFSKMYNGQIDDSPQARLIFHLADRDNNTELVYMEFQQVFADFDTDHNGNVTSTEFIDLWINKSIGQVEQGVMLFFNLDVNKDFVIDQNNDVPYIFKFFDRNANSEVSEGEFVIQWVKISL